MLVYILEDGGEKVWHVGGDPPARRHNDAKCKFLQADGNELQFVLHNFKNIPNANHRRVVAWTGDIADFIFKNI